MIVSGAPTKHKNHAVYISEMSLDALQAIQDVTDPSCGDHVGLRIGIVWSTTSTNTALPYGNSFSTFKKYIFFLFNRE